MVACNMKLPFCCFSVGSTHYTNTTLPGERYYGNFCVFSSEELEIATHNFSSHNKIGEGAFGTVYKGRLQDGSLVAVKALSIEIESMRGEREFISELAALSDLRHENLVTLQGCCVDGTRRYLVYEHLENNSLAHTVLGKEQNRMKFNWEARKGITLGVARALAYLHEEIQPRILHRDIKASNILLDQNYVPKLADFGLARILRDNESHISTRVAGTLGYLAPEYAISGRLTQKSDVYSFGVLLLEIISGRPAVDFDLVHGEHYLVQQAWDTYKDTNLVQMVDPTLNLSFLEEEAIRFLKVSLLCVQENAKFRPEMSAVVNMLTSESNIIDAQISEPGFISDLMDIKIHQSHSTQTNSSRAPPSQT